MIRLPFISNFTDFDALRDEPDVQLRYVNKAEDLGNPDLVILPGSKNTLDDLGFLHESGLAVMLKQRWHNSGPVMGICGGYQMMGRLVRDPYHTESNRDEIPGLDILPMETEFYPEKYTVQSQGRIIGDNLFLKRCQGQTVVGYEIHMGRSFADKGTNYLFELSAADSPYLDGLAPGRPWVPTCTEFLTMTSCAGLYWSGSGNEKERNARRTILPPRLLFGRLLLINLLIWCAGTWTCRHSGQSWAYNYAAFYLILCFFNRSNHRRSAQNSPSC